MYKLFIGDYLDEGTPATWTLVCCNTRKSVINRVIKELLPRLKMGMELYIVYNNEVHAYFRDKMRRV